MVQRILLFFVLAGFALQGQGETLVDHSEQTSRPTAPRPIEFPKVEVTVDNIFLPKRTLKALVSNLDDSSPVEKWDEVFQKPANQTWGCEKDKLVSLYQQAKAKLKELPERLQAVRDNTETVSMEAWRNRVPGAKLAAYADDIAYRYPFTQAAKQALSILIHKHHERGEHGVASLYADQLLSDFPKKDEASGMLLLCAAIYERTGQAEKASDLLEEVKNRGPKSAALVEAKYRPVSPNLMQSVTAELYKLSVSKESGKRDRFLRLARMMAPDDLTNKMYFMIEDELACSVLAAAEAFEKKDPELDHAKWESQIKKLAERHTDKLRFVATAKLEIAGLRAKVKPGDSIVEVFPHFEFVAIKPGKFNMGSPDGTTKDKEGNLIAAEAGREEQETLPHEVEITKPIWFQKNEVTQLQWYAVMGKAQLGFKSLLHPARSVSWHQAQEFIDKLNLLDPKHQYRLPTEAEWEYAARAGTDTAYSFGNDEKKLHEYTDYSAGGAKKEGAENVAFGKPNSWGLYGTHGGVWEWTMDTYAYDSGPPKDVNPDYGHPVNLASGSLRVIRGGGSYLPRRYRSAARLHPIEMSNGYGSVGLRLVRTPKTPE